METKDRERYRLEMDSYTPPLPTKIDCVASAKMSVVPRCDIKAKKLKKDPNRPKCNSAYNFCMKSNRDRIIAETVGASNTEILRKIGEAWSKRPLPPSLPPSPLYSTYGIVRHIALSHVVIICCVRLLCSPTH